MTNEQVVFSAKTSKEPTILRSWHRVIDEPRGGMRTNSDATDNERLGVRFCPFRGSPQTHSILTMYGMTPYIRLGREDL